MKRQSRTFKNGEKGRGKKRGVIDLCLVETLLGAYAQASIALGFIGTHTNTPLHAVIAKVCK